MMGAHSAGWGAPSTTESVPSAPGWPGGGGADSRVIRDDDNAARRDAGAREPAGHRSGVS
jgi:hypothetical protein